MKSLITALALLASVIIAHAETYRVIDGDTFVLGQERIRLKGPDAPELRSSRCLAERRMARKATIRLGELLMHEPIRIQRDGIDRYGRTLAYVYTADDQEVGEVLVAEGLAVKWKPGRAAWAERAKYWCGKE